MEHAQYTSAGIAYTSNRPVECWSCGDLIPAGEPVELTTATDCYEARGLHLLSTSEVRRCGACVQGR